MRAFLLIAAACLLLCSTPALAVDDFYGPGEDGKTVFDDSRRPDLGIGRERRPHDGVLPRAGDSAWEEFYVEDIDLSGFLERLYVVLTAEEHLGRYPEVRQVAEYLDKTGFFDIQSSHAEYSITGDYIHFATGTAFGELAPDSFYAKYYGLPDKPLASANYVTEGDYLLYLAVTSLPEKLLVYIEQMLENQKMMGAEGGLGELLEELGVMDGMGAGDASEVLMLLGLIQPEQIIQEFLSGELAVVFWGVPEMGRLIEGDIMPQDIDAAVMVGLADAAQFEGLLDMYGAEAGLERVESGDSAWRSYHVPWEEGFGLLVNDELAVVTTNLYAMHERLTGQRGRGLDIDPCQFYLDVNMERMQEEVMGPLARLGAKMLGEEVQLPVDSMAYLVNLPGSDELGHMTFSSYHPDGDCYMEMSMKKAVVQYLVFYLGLALCGAGQAGAF